MIPETLSAPTNAPFYILCISLLTCHPRGVKHQEDGNWARHVGENK